MINPNDSDDGTQARPSIWEYLISCLIILLALGVHIAYLPMAGPLSSAGSLVTKNYNRDHNFIIILTDDQHADTLNFMPILARELASRGITFENAFATDPECCPFRASLLSGGYRPNQTGVKANEALNGSRTKFNEKNTLATRLQGAGYKTGFIGKYLHGYKPGIVPPGWSSFIASPTNIQSQNWLAPTKITVGSSNTREERGMIIDEIPQYITDFHTEKALEFIEQNKQEPFFLSVNVFAPHVPATPASSDQDLFSDYQYDATREADISDKPMWVRSSARFSCTPEMATEVMRGQLQSLQAVDRMVGAIIAKLQEDHLLEKTIIFFTSDNGLDLGTHQTPCDKGMAYEDSIHVPFVFYMEGQGAGQDDRLIATNLDIGATIYDIVGIDEKVDGLSLVAHVEEKPETWRDAIVIENYGYLDWYGRLNPDRAIRPLPIWAGLRTNDWKYIEYTTGETELYDLRRDPKELDNLADDPEAVATVADLRARLGRQKGLVLTSLEAPAGQIGVPYSFPLAAWGGQPPYRWIVANGKLPKGLRLDKASGLISGVPTQAGESSLVFQVVDSSHTRHSLTNEQFSWKFKIIIQNQ